MRGTLKHLLAEVHACTACAEDLPLGPRPVVQMGSRARIAIVGQAPGRKVHDSGVPWHPSWRSRLWMDKNPWFAREVLPELKSAVAARLP